MPILVRGKARARQNRPNPPPVVILPVVSEESAVISELPSVESPEEIKVSKQDVTYRVPKEESLLDLPLEEEILEEEANELDERTYNVMPVDNPVSIGAVLKKKRKEHK